MRRDQRSPEASAYRMWYQQKVWKLAREMQLGKEPLCEWCAARGVVTPATVVNHVIPHKGNWLLFIDPDNHASVCKACHDGPIAEVERKGYNRDIGLDGWPTDPRHPYAR